MKIKFRKYNDGVHDIRFNEKVSEIGMNEPFFGNAVVECRMDKSAHQVILNCELEIPVKFECDRCLKKFETEINTDFSLAYFFNREEVKEDDEGVYYLAPEEDEITLDGDVSDYANLAVPMKKLCSEECSGICSGCGVNLNENDCTCSEEKINPVWEPLLKLKNKDNQ